MSRLNTKKASGPDGITAKELKVAAQELSYSIANICRMGYMQGKYPSSWKEGKVKSVVKSGVASDRGNDRPLTLLSIPSKVSEAVICDQLDNQVEKIRHKNQWAYKKGAAGITGGLYKLIENYMDKRKQYVEIRDTRSEMREVKYSVPQGSLMGPGLFSIYINDIAYSASNGEVHLYADDVTAYVTSKTVDDCVNKLNQLAREINTWSQENKMAINIRKTEAMIINRKKFMGPLTPISIGGNIIEYKENSKLLGVYIDNKLNWDTHIDKVYKQFSQKLSILKKSKFLPTKVLEEIYFKTVIPTTTYAMTVWGTCASSKLQKVENQHIRAARLIKNIPRTVDSNKVVEVACSKNLGYMYNKKVVTEMYKIIKGKGEHALKDKFTMSLYKRNRLQVIRPRSEFERNTLSSRGPVLWNALPETVKEAKNIKNFKYKLKNKATTELKTTTFIKGITVTRNKDSENFIYY